MDGNIFNVKSIKDIQQQQKFAEANILTEKSKAPKYRLNGYDSAIINKNKLEYFENENFNLDFQIKEKENDLTSIIGQIKRAETYGSANEVLTLKSKKKRIEQKLYELRNQKEETQFAIKDLKPKTKADGIVKKINSFVSKNILAKFSKKINSVVFLGNSLENLAEINQQVGEIIGLQTPFGESKDNYEKLTEYLLEANKISANISKTIDKIN